MTSIADQIFRGEAVRLDGKKFLRCTFEDCVLHYGGEACEWESSRFVNCRIVIDGKAHHTVQVLTGLGFRLIEPGKNGPRLHNPEVQ